MSQHEITVLATSTDGGDQRVNFVIDVLDVEDIAQGQMTKAAAAVKPDGPITSCFLRLRRS